MFAFTVMTCIQGQKYISKNVHISLSPKLFQMPIHIIYDIGKWLHMS